MNENEQDSTATMGGGGMNTGRKRGRRNALKPNSEESQLLQEFAVTYQMGSFQLGSRNSLSGLMQEEKTMDNEPVERVTTILDDDLIRPSQMLTKFADKEGEEEEKDANSEIDEFDDDEELRSHISNKRVRGSDITLESDDVGGEIRESSVMAMSESSSVCFDRAPDIDDKIPQGVVSVDGVSVEIL